MGRSISAVVLLSCFMVSVIHAARRVKVEDLVADRKLRFADEFKRRADDGNPPGLEDLLDLPKEEDLDRKNSIKTAKNVAKTKFEQVYQNIPVYGSHITAAENPKTGKSTEEVTGIIIKDIQEDIKTTKHRINGKKALKIAKDYHKHEKTASDSATLRIYEQNGKAHVVYIVSYLAVDEGKLIGPVTVVDAKTKQVIDTWEGLPTAWKSLTGYGGNSHVGRFNFNGKPGQFRKLRMTVDKTDSSRCLMENKHVRLIDLNGTSFVNDSQVMDMMSRTKTLPTVAVDCNVEPIPNKEINDAYNVRNDVYYFAYHTFKMYETFNLNVYNERLELWVNFTEPSIGGSAAAWNEFLFVNNGDDIFYPMSSYPDVLAHEIGHTFTMNNSKLEYRNHSGAMNEAFSDMSGVTFKKYLLGGEAEWKLAKDVYRDTSKEAMRFMNDPPRDGASIDHIDQYNDDMNVHNTSGIYNKAFYLLATTEDWSVEKAFETFARANIMYWGSTSTFNEGACGVINAAKDFGYSESDVIEAFNGVGVECKTGENVVI